MEQMEQLEEQRLARLNENLNSKKTSDGKQYDNFEKEFKSGEEYEDAEISPEEFKEITVQKPEMPYFPLLIFTLALFKDFIDITVAVIIFMTAGIGVILTVITWIITALIATIIWFWMFNKSTFVRKYIIKKYTRKAVLFLIGKMIPILNATPTASLTVYLVYKSEYGLVKKIVDVVEEIEKVV